MYRVYVHKLQHLAFEKGESNDSYVEPGDHYCSVSQIYTWNGVTDPRLVGWGYFGVNKQ